VFEAWREYDLFRADRVAAVRRRNKTVAVVQSLDINRQRCDLFLRLKPLGIREIKV
jgi:hypothetical protein